MPDIIPPAIPPLNPLTPDRIGIRAQNIRTANGTTDRDQSGALIPVGTVFVATTPGEWAGDVFVRDRLTVVIPDVAAWLTALAGASDPLAAEAAAQFAAVETGLLWLTRLRLSQDGVCDRPTA